MAITFARGVPSTAKAFLIDGEYIKQKTGLDEYSREIDAMEGDELLGSIFFWWGGECAMIEALAVYEEHRGRQIGRALMEEAEKDMKEAGVTQVTVSTLPFQAPKFYEKLGYVQISTIPKFLAGCDLAVYRKEI